MKIVNLSELNPHWDWLARAMDDTTLQWHHITSSADIGQFRQHPMKPLIRVRAAHRAVRLARTGDGLLVSHGPRSAMYAGLVQKAIGPVPRHLVFSFNFTSLPLGLRRLAITQGLKWADRFVVSSNLERTLYAAYFDLPEEQIDMLHWSIQPPDVSSVSAPVKGPYVCAVGSQARDYAVLVEAMRRLPGMPLHIICHPSNVEGLSLPPNVTTHFNTPLSFAQALTAHARLMVLPLEGNDVPCGHVTAVTAMHLGVPIVATDSKGLHDYLRHESTALLSPAKDPTHLAAQIQRMWEDARFADQVATNAKAFAAEHCTEANAVAYLRRYLSRELHH